ncbi:MAG TPA: tRNA pseudouridine(38-40) synthase TruA [Blastocatellia bacterium]|nr:tRNA pseudouridine(38-40) synthase TruA [Blastocatellia bacterium]
MQNYKLTIAYDGTDYHGWQMQANARTIQGELTRVLTLLDHRKVTLHGAGRTDAGVHAEAQVASVFLEREFAPDQLRDAINGNLNRDLRVTGVELADEGFNARFSAKKKTYRYAICTAPVVRPCDFRYVYHYRGALDVAAMRCAAALLVGEHDFSAFTIAALEIEDRVRRLTRLDVETDGQGIRITAAADGFLRYMVRTIAGTLIDVGRGRRSAEMVGAALASRRREDAGATAPAHGLTLVRVDY